MRRHQTEKRAPDQIRTPVRLQRRGHAPSNACSEGSAVPAPDATKQLPQAIRAALVRDYVAREEKRRAATRTPVVVAVDAPDIHDAPDMMKCTACGTLQPERERCDVCGAHQ